MAIIFTLFFVLSIASLFIYRNKKLALSIGFGGGAATCLISAWYFLSNMYNTNTFELFGNFLQDPYFTASTLENFFCFIISTIGFFAGIYSIGYVKDSKLNLGAFAAIYNSFILSMLMVMTATDMFAFILLWEIMTLVSGLFIYMNDHEDKNALSATMIYLGFSQIGAFCIVVAFVIMSAASGGSYEFLDFKGLEFSPAMNLTLLVLLFIGFGNKAGVWPLHVWLAVAHPCAPSNASAMMSGIMTKVALFGLIKFSLLLDITTTFAYIVMFCGAASALFGILYAAVDNDYKRTIAYSSVENIGIITTALGVGYYGLATESNFIAIIGFIAAFFHIINHATFKSMLFFASGAVTNATHTRELNILGGLHQKMPYTSYAFMIGSIAICAIPPLNGFMSEWVLYQSFIATAGEAGAMAKLMLVIAMLCIGLAGALAIMTFVKVYSAIFLGKPRDTKIYEHAKEGSLPMLFTTSTLAVFCVILGLFSATVIANLAKVTSTIFGLNLEISNLNIVKTPSVLFVLVALAVIAFIILKIFKANNSKVRLTEPWASGFKWDANMQIASQSFAGDLRKVLKFFYRNKPTVVAKNYFDKVEYSNKPKEIWWIWLYEPVVNWCVKFADKIGIVQNGKSNIYALYILIYLFVCFAAAYYIY
ncbi:Hydrogenase-4 component B [Campylobacter majalis]|uniref:Hydrogenase-4 component B n=1 Tax=Campylobacter majalis TaxID=2790656 RepID=A0ABM8Q5C1_9BACT|nr:proton-conducting transporter membrane subunit [Campylobacter majalis]CAD7288098.1 Hydrogenase-4 component B [Campylobacter majalis]